MRECRPHGPRVLSRAGQNSSTSLPSPVKRSSMPVARKTCQMVATLMGSMGFRVRARGQGKCPRWRAWYYIERWLPCRHRPLFYCFQYFFYANLGYGRGRCAIQAANVSYLETDSRPPGDLVIVHWSSHLLAFRPHVSYFLFFEPQSFQTPILQTSARNSRRILATRSASCSHT